jgi:diaminopimelate epimerase
MRVRRYHALGNDYLVLEEEGPALSPDRVRLLCDRHRGVGGDGVLEPLMAVGADCGLRIWNPDGSVAEKSGNGLRIFARWLVEHRGAPEDLVIALPGERAACRVQGAPGPARPVRAHMGRARFEPAEVPVARALRASPVAVGGALLPLTAVGLGNPHCVIFVEAALDELPWRAWGAELERSPLFPNRTNVQVARVVARDRVEARVWERGAGETAASGSSATAVVAAGRLLGLLDAAVVVEMPGGALRVEEEADGSLVLEGPVDEVGLVLPAPELLWQLAALPGPVPAG